jgi:transposase-like protein
MDLATDSLSQAQSGPSPEVLPERPKRRSFSAAYKLNILRRVDACREPGEVGRLLRSEGLYSSYVTGWRREHDEGALSAMSKKRGRKPERDPKDEENERLRREIAQLKERLERAETIISIQKKVSEILGIPLKTDKPDGSDS